MKVREVMTKETAFCGLETNLAAAVKLMVKHGCGFLPVVGEGGNVIAAITDRDISILLGSRDEKASNLLVREIVLPGHSAYPLLYTCTPDDDIHCVLKMMREARVHRLPVIDREGALLGVLSLDDIMLRAHEGWGKQGISYEDVMDASKQICRRDLPRGTHPVAA